MTTLTITSKDFHKGTIANFVIAEQPATPADFISNSGSEYRYTSEGVYRTSDHWGWAKSCYWTIDSKLGCVRGKVTGFAKFADMRRDVVYLKNQLMQVRKEFGYNSEEFKLAQDALNCAISLLK